MNLAAATPSSATDAPSRSGVGARLWQSLLEATPLLSADDAQALAALATQRTVGAGERIFDRDAPAQHLVLLTEGAARVADQSWQAPAWLDAASAWTRTGRHVVPARALGPAGIAEWPRAGVQELLLQRPALAPALLAVLAQQVQRLAVQAHELMHKDAASRLAAWLQRQAQGAAMPWRLCERKRDIAAQLGMTPETLSRQLRQFSRGGLIEVHGYQVRVLDGAGLARLASAG